MNSRSRTVLALILVSLGAAAIVRGDVTLPSIISDHMVLQRSAETLIWGKAAPNEKVKVTLDSSQGEAIADTDGKWKVKLNLASLKEGPFKMLVQGTNQITVSDMLIGEVWLGTGQSNMVLYVKQSLGGADEIAQSENPRLRYYKIDYNASDKPVDDIKGSWVLSNPETSPGFCAVGYYFAKDLQKALNTPVGFIRDSWAGTPIIDWVSFEGLDGNPDMKSYRDTALANYTGYPQKKQDYTAAMLQWEAANGRQGHPGDAAQFAGVQVPETDWKKVELPAKLQDLGLPDSGAVWFRTHISLTAPTHSTVVGIQAGAPRDYVTIYWNGQKIGDMTEATSDGKGDAMQQFHVPPELLQNGDNILAIRLFTPREKALFTTPPSYAVGPIHTPLTNWLAKTEFELPALTVQARQSCPQLASQPGTTPTYLFNGMISPVIPTTLAGVIWYQGEQDTGRPNPGTLYQKMLEALILDWRKHWGTELPFIICQLPNYGVKTDDPGESKSTWAEIRQAQLAALKLPKTAEPILIDLGDKDVHPIDKKPVGERVALAALGAFYNQKVTYSGPIYDSMKTNGDKLVLSFRFAEGGLVAKPLPTEYRPTYMSPDKLPLIRHSPDSPLEGFAICGEDKKWVWADAKIDGQTIVVSSPAVTKPVAVRYGWADNPTCNLYGASGLPASPFEETISP